MVEAVDERDTQLGVQLIRRQVTTAELTSHSLSG